MGTGGLQAWVSEKKGAIRPERLGFRPGAGSSSNPLSPGSWQDYYTWRGLSLDSPMAVLLTYPLTVYYVITHLVPQSCKEFRVGWGDVGAGGVSEKDHILKSWPLLSP